MSKLKDTLKYFAGYVKKDAMREKAQKLLGGELAKTSMEVPASRSEPAKTPMRLYKAGGHVHPLTKEQTDMHLPRKETPKVIGMHETDKMKKGGHAKKHCQKFAAGGAAKIRHKQATAAGKPILKKVNKEKA
jgi:hypothetical protein